MVSGTALRCLFVEDTTEGASGLYGQVATDSLFVNSVIAHNSLIDRHTSRATLVKCNAVNVTLADNGDAWAMYAAANDPNFTHDAINCLMVYAGALRETNGVTVAGTVCALVAPHKQQQIFAATFDDWRLLPWSDAVGIGDPSALATVKAQMDEAGVPAAYGPYLDYAGTTIPSSGAIDAGAVQGAETPAGGGLHFTTSTRMEIDGRTAVRPGQFVYPSKYPVQYRVKPVLAAGKYAFCYTRTSPETNTASADIIPHLFPGMDETFVMMPPPDPSYVCTNALKVCDYVYHVSPDGSDSNDGLSQSTPWETLKYACEQCTPSKYTIILAQGGTYAKGVTNTPSYGPYRLYASDSRFIRFKGVEGAGNTFLEGSPDSSTLDSETYPGCGANAIKGIRLNGSYLYFQGFTIRNCYGGAASADDGMRNATAVFAAYNSMLADCVITNCHAIGPIATGANFLRCRILANTSRNGMIRYNSYPQWNSSCYFAANTNEATQSNAGNAIVNGGSSADMYARLFNCTLVGDIRTGRLAAAYSTSWNCIYDGGANLYSTALNTNCIVWNCAATSWNHDSFTVADPLFVNRAMDGKILSLSPAVGHCDAPSADNYGQIFWKYASTDIEGNMLAIAADGKMTAGAFHMPVPFVYAVYSPVSSGGIAVSGLSSGSNLVAATSQDVTFAPVPGKRPCIGIAVNGTTNLFTNGDASQISISGTELVELADGSEVAISPICTANWYVDPTNGNDSASGYFPISAKKTLADAMRATTAAGDTVHALPGVYEEGAMTNNPNRIGHERVVVKSGRKLVSVEGPERTIIRGGGVDTTVENDSTALRCAYLGGVDAVLDGFTLEGGRSAYVKTSYQSAGCDEEDVSGGAVLGASLHYRAPRDGVEVRNCIIRGNMSNHGAVMRCQLVNCRVEGNNTGNTLAYQVSSYGSFFDSNVCDNLFAYSANVMNTTVTSNHVKRTGIPVETMFVNPGYTPADRSRIYNSVLAGVVNVKSGTADVSNCVIRSGSSLTVSEGGVGGNFVVPIASTHLFAFDANGAPVIGVNPAVDMADPSLVAGYPCDPSFDLNGNQRVWNASMDAGAIEADWRGRYAKRLAPSGLAVARADPMVVDGGTFVAITNGTLAASWMPKGGKKTTYRFNVRVTGNGILSVVANDEDFASVTSADGVKELVFSNRIASNSLSFVYTPGDGDTGAAELYDFFAVSGMSISFR